MAMGRPLTPLELSESDLENWIEHRSISCGRLRPISSSRKSRDLMNKVLRHNTWLSDV